MCLKLNIFSKKRIAKDDITVYKFLTKDDGILITPYRFSVVIIGNTYISKIERESMKIFKALHSFKTFKIALKACFEYSRSNLFIVECIIPKGSTYYKGKFFGKKSYASDKLIYIKELDVY